MLNSKHSSVCNTKIYFSCWRSNSRRVQLVQYKNVSIKSCHSMLKVYFFIEYQAEIPETSLNSAEALPLFDIPFVHGEEIKIRPRNNRDFPRQAVYHKESPELSTGKKGRLLKNDFLRRGSPGHLSRPGFQAGKS